MPTLKEWLTGLINAGLLATFVAMMMAWAWAFKQYRAGNPLLPSVKPRDVPWRAGSIGLVVLTWVLANSLVVDLYDLLTGRPPRLERSLIEKMTLVALLDSVILLAVPLLLHATSKARLKDLGLERSGWKSHAIQGIVAFLLVTLPINLINIVCTLIWTPKKHPLQDMVMETPTGEVAYLACLSAVVLAPAAEELLFRAVIQSWLIQSLRNLRPSARTETPAQATSPSMPDEWRSELELHSVPGPGAPQASPDAPWDAQRSDRWERISTGAGIAITSALFAVAHSPQWPAPVAIFFLSLALGTVFQRTGSLWSSFVLHALFNGLSTAFLFLTLISGDEGLKKVAPPRAFCSGTEALRVGPVVPHREDAVTPIVKAPTFAPAAN